jgi:hypothetical protein
LGCARHSGDSGTTKAGTQRQETIT